MAKILDLYIKDGLDPREVNLLSNFLIPENSIDKSYKNFVNLSLLYLSWTFFKPFTILELIKKYQSFERLTARNTVCLFSSSAIYIAKGQQSELSPWLIGEALDFCLNLNEELSALKEEQLLVYKNNFYDTLDFFKKNKHALTDTDNFIELLKNNIVLLKETPLEPQSTSKQATVSEKEGVSYKKSTDFKVYHKTAVEGLIKKLKSSPSEDVNGLQKTLLENMRDQGEFRKLSPVTNVFNLKSLYEDFPHFQEVIEFIERHLALSRLGGASAPIIVPPMLIVGPPGCGKSFFAQKVAEILNLVYFEKDLSVTSEAFVLSGLDAGWKNSKPGLVFSAIVEGQTANPLICLNEVDKAKITGAQSSPLNSLYSLLESSTSKKFQDEFIPVDLDASKIFWILTANELDLPEAILSRMEVFNISAPNPEQTKLIAQSIWKALLNGNIPKENYFSKELSDDVLNLLKNETPRLIRRILLNAASLAALKQDKDLNSSHVCEIINKKSKSSGVKHTIGFIS